jgi:hypothetical protein
MHGRWLFVGWNGGICVFVQFAWTGRGAAACVYGVEVEPETTAGRQAGREVGRVSIYIACLFYM